MAFAAKRLRVQLPCGETTVLPCGEATRCGETAARNVAAEVLPRRDPATLDRGLGTVGLLGLALLAGCKPNHTCYHTPWPVLEPGPEGSETVLVDAVDLPVLRAQLEAQLARINWQLSDIEAAEKALEDLGPSSSF